MSRKTTILLIILLVLLIAGGFVGFYLYLNKGAAPTTEEETGTTPPDLFPFPQNSPPGTLPGTGPNPSSGENGTTPPPFAVGKLKRISTEPVAGATFFTGERGLSVRYLEQKTLPRIFEVSLQDNARERLANTEISPIVYEGIWAEKGKGVIIRYLKNDDVSVESLYAKLVNVSKASTTSSRLGASTVEESSTRTIDAMFLPLGVRSIAVSPAGDKFFYLSTNTGGSTSGIIINPDGSKKTTIFDSPSDEWIASWPTNDRITLQTKASYSAPGYFYSLNTKSLLFEQLLGGIKGLTASMSPSGDRILYASGADSTITTSIYTLKTGNSITISAQTLPEKCVWSRSMGALYCATPKKIARGDYPDIWYQGGAHFDDTLVKVDAATGGIETLADLGALTKTAFDGTHLLLDSEETHLLIQNNNDQTLWVFDLE